MEEEVDDKIKILTGLNRWRNLWEQRYEPRGQLVIDQYLLLLPWKQRRKGERTLYVELKVVLEKFMELSIVLNLKEEGGPS